jgi:hypothetical protein
LDTRALQQSGFTDDNGDSVLHGTYTPIPYLSVIEIAGQGPSRVLLVFDDSGCFCHFTWNGAGAWVSKPGPYDFTVGGASPYSRKPATLTRYPTLELDSYDVNDVPSNAAVGALYVRSVGDPTTSHPVAEQQIKYDPLAKTLTWSSAAHNKGLELTRVFRQPSEKGAGSETFGDVFHGQYQFAGAAFPFYGFDPRHMDLYPSQSYELAGATGGAISGSGTPVVHDYSTNIHQTFNGTLIFTFPQEGSLDYVRGVDMDNAPYLPIGLTGLGVDEAMDQTETVMLSSVADRMQSWSRTLGLNGGIEGLFSVDLTGSYQDKVETQQKTESRYTLSRRVTINWIGLADIPSLQLHGDVVGELQSRVKRLLGGASDLEWDKFVTRFGTHYAHAMTEGRIEVVETRFTLDDETNSYTAKKDLKIEASAVIDAGEFGAKADFGSEWSDKSGGTVTGEYVSTFSLGADYPVAIMFDLRPFTELLSPVFVRYDPDDQWGGYAPWVWFDLRDDFAAYLAKLGLGAPIPESLTTDLTPRSYKITFPSISLSGGDPGEVDLVPSSASLTVKGLAEDPVQGSELAQQHGFDIAEQPVVLGQQIGFSSLHGSIRVDGAGFALDPAAFFATITGKPGAAQPLRFLLDVNLEAMAFPDGPDGPGLGIGPFKWLAYVELDSAKSTPTTILSPSVNRYILSIELAAQDLGPLFH